MKKESEETLLRIINTNFLWKILKVYIPENLDVYKVKILY